MKEFFQKHSYDMVKMFLNQFATAVFGFALVMAAGKAENPTLRNVTSAFAIVFYLFLLYMMTWELGFKDRIPVQRGNLSKNLFRGALISLCANIPNFLFAIFIMLASLTDVSFLNSVGGVCASLAVFLEGMYTGLMANPIAGNPINSYWITYFLIPLPAILTCGLSYLLGFFDKKFTPLLTHVYPKSDRDVKEKRDEDKYHE